VFRDRVTTGRLGYDVAVDGCVVTTTDSIGVCPVWEPDRGAVVLGSDEPRLFRDRCLSQGQRRQPVGSGYCSYALAAAAANPGIGVHFLDDYNLVMSRTAFVPAGAAHPELGERFVSFLLSMEGQRAIAERSALLPIADVPLPADTVGSITALAEADFLPIRLGPGLLTWLDRLKRARFIDAWEASMLPDASVPRVGPGR